MKYRSRIVRSKEKRSRRQAILYLFLSIVFIVGIFKVGVPGFIQLVSWWSGKDAGKQSTDLEVAPQAPVLASLPEATFSAQIKVEGMTQRDLKVRLTVNGSPIDEITAKEDGSFVFEKVDLKKGDNQLELVSINEKNRESSTTSAMINMDNTAPELKILQPENEASFISQNEINLTIKGTVDKKDADVRVNGNYVFVNSDGNFEYRTKLSEGVNEFVVSATDPAGNTAEQLLRVNFSL